MSDQLHDQDKGGTEAKQAPADRAKEDAPAREAAPPIAAKLEGAGRNVLLARDKTGTSAAAATAGMSAAKQGAPNEIVARLELQADTESVDRTKLTLAELRSARVGHAWITLTYKDPTKIPATVGSPTEALLKRGGTSLGFWPLIHRAAQWDPRSAQYARLKERMQAGFTPGAGASPNPDHTGFSKNPFNSYVPGRVEEPDTAHKPKATKGYDLTQAQVDSLMTYVNSKRGASYSLYFFNCTTFAVEAAAAAGQSAPGGAMMGICLPNALYRDILAMKLGGDPEATTKNLEPGEKETPPKPRRR